jgi:hypothetical protein
MEQKPMPCRAIRLSQGPIIYPHMDKRMGSNINGPALIRMPDWAQGKLGAYHLYFSDHKGDYIRLAYADSLTGPWRMHTPGVLDLTDSLFPAEDPPEPEPEHRPAWAPKMKGGYLYAHIASPDVHVDVEARCFRMYYHGLLWNGDQGTRLAVSDDGLNFWPRDPILGPPYFRAFQYKDHIYTITWGGEIWRSDSWEAPFERGPAILPFAVKQGVGHGFRHGEVHRRGDLLHVFFTQMGDWPERILHATVTLSGDWLEWTAKGVRDLLEPELEWEGADLPLRKSTMGAEMGRVRELRDPCVFQDADGATYLLYCGAGESGIGIAELSNW